MAPRKRRLLVGSLGSLVWPAIVVLIPAGITFAAARVYAEGAPLPPKCDNDSVTACAGKGTFEECGFGYYGGGKGICFPWSCVNDAGDASPGHTCVDVQFCRDVSDQDCRSRTLGADCNDAGGTCKSVTGMMGEPQSACYESDAGVGVQSVLLKCVPKDGVPSGASSSSSGDNGGTSGAFVPGPATVPGSSSSSGSSDDSGCSTTSSNTSTLPLVAAPLAIGLLFALRKKRKRG